METLKSNIKSRVANYKAWLRKHGWNIRGKIITLRDYSPTDYETISALNFVVKYGGCILQREFSFDETKPNNQPYTK